jgi:hypothetical protein
MGRLLVLPGNREQRTEIREQRAGIVSGTVSTPYSLLPAFPFLLLPRDFVLFCYT